MRYFVTISLRGRKAPPSHLVYKILLHLSRILSSLMSGSVFDNRFRSSVWYFVRLDLRCLTHSDLRDNDIDAELCFPFSFLFSLWCVFCPNFSVMFFKCISSSVCLLSYCNFSFKGSFIMKTIRFPAQVIVSSTSISAYYNLWMD